MDKAIEAAARALANAADENWNATDFRETLSGNSPESMRAGYRGAAAAAIAALPEAGFVVVPAKAAAAYYGFSIDIEPTRLAAMIAAAAQGNE